MLCDNGKDIAIIDFEGFVGDEKIEHGEGKNYTLDLANSNFIPGFAEGLVGQVIATDGIAVIANLNNPTEDMTVDQVNAIYVGEAYTWDEVVE